MAKKKSTNLELMAITGEYENFCKMFPYIAHHLGIDKFFERNNILIRAVSEGQHKLLVDNVEFDDKNEPIMEVVENKIIDIGGKPKEQPRHDWKYKSEIHKEAFLSGEKELQEAIVEINL